ncbi:MAG: thymidine phosphorylase [Alphaproteobacteria bacterium]|jgi:thymidine phosphorylase|nr:thymidine phosphorylase [Alphaproteobacteria bacterium]
MFLVKELIRKKRDKQELSKEEIDFFVKGVSDNSMPNEQISAMAMAIFFNDLNANERKNLTLAMRDSGDVITFTDLSDKPIVDKHSTGGVGDLVSIPLAPIVASLGAYVPMITGKGLGHTGGTTDKMDSIPNYNTYPSTELFKKVVREVGCAIIGQTSNLAPADKKIYAVRDSTATVESIPLIASSILSKKLASGIHYLVMDIKTGSGAFMDSTEKAQALAQTIVGIANSANVPTTALITDMNECLSSNIGNSLEIAESIEYLTGVKREPKLHEIIVALATEMLTTTKIAANATEARAKIEETLNNGRAAEVFEKMVFALGGNSSILSNYKKVLPKSKYQKEIYLDKSGYITDLDNRSLGLTLVHLGGGRKTPEDKLDLSVGLENVAKIGAEVNKNTPFAILHYNNENQFSEISKILNNVVEVSDNKEAIKKIKPVYERIS